MEVYRLDFQINTLVILNGYILQLIQKPYITVNKSLKLNKNGATSKDISNHLKIFRSELCSQTI